MDTNLLMAAVPSASPKSMRSCGLLFLLIVVSCALPASSRSPGAIQGPSAPTAIDRGLLASTALDNQPMKAVYFFPGSKTKNTSLYTTHPVDSRDSDWNTDAKARAWVLDNMVSAHVNTIVMSYWSESPRSSPMALATDTLPDLLQSIGDRKLVVLPAIESSNAWSFADEFPTDAGGAAAPGFIDRIGEMVALFEGRMNLWAQMYDRDGKSRYAVNILHASSNVIRQVAGDADDQAFAAAFDRVADQVQARFGIRVGFTLDAVQGQSYSATPYESAVALETTPSVLAIQDFEPEVYGDVVKAAAPCIARSAGCVAYDNNVDNLAPIVAFKRNLTRDWVKTGVPVILSVSNGMDGRYVWAKYGVGFWGDNADYTDDRFRNWVSELKGNGIKGITFDTWNGYTEGYAATRSVEHGDTVFEWLTDLLSPDPRKCSHVQYANGERTYRVYGSICSKWIALGADRRFGAPTSPELSTAHGRVSHFADGKSIYWSRSTHAHEVHGIIETTYVNAGVDSSCLGLPTSDEESDGFGGRESHFEHGLIDWKPGDAHGAVTCTSAN